MDYDSDNEETSDNITYKELLQKINEQNESIKSLKPYTKVKMAISRDEKIAWSNYKSKWISNIKSRNFN